MNLKNIIFLFISFFLYHSCGPRSEVVAGPNNNSKSPAIEHYLITSIGDTLPTGVPIPLQGSRMNAAELIQSNPPSWEGTPELIASNRHIHPAGTPQKIPVPQNLTIATPGKQGLSLPDTLAVSILVVPAPQSKPTPVPALRMRENAVTNIQYLGVEEGLSDYYTHSLLEDSRGNLWFGNKDCILNKYDGQSLTYYPSPAGHPEHFHIHESLIEDSNGNIWVGTPTGIGKYDGVEFTYFSSENSAKNGLVNTVMEDSQGRIWFGTNSVGAGYYDGQNIIQYTTKEGLLSNDVRKILEDNKGNLWFVTPHGVSCYDGQSFTQFTKEEGLIHNSVRSILQDSKGDFWFGTDGGMSHYNGKFFSNFSATEGLSTNTVRNIFEDSKKRLWISLTDSGINRFDGHTFVHFSEDNGTNSTHADPIIEDSYGNIWVGTNEGVHCYKNTAFSYYNEELKFADVADIMEDNHGNIWFAAYGSGTTNPIQFDNHNFIHYPKKDNQDTPVKPRSLMKDSKGRIWYGTTNDGAIQFSSSAVTSQNMLKRINLPFVTDIVEHQNKEIWFSGIGLTLFDGEELTNFIVKDGLIHDWFNVLTAGEEEGIWFGSLVALGRYDGQAFTYFTQKEGLVNNWVRSLLKDRKGRLWVGTEGGLSLFDGKDFINFTQKDGLANNRILTITEDNEQNIWLGTQNGLSILKPDRADPTAYKIFNFGTEDGLKQADFVAGSALLDSKNRMWWGKTKGVMMLDLNEFQLPSKAPRIHFNYLEIAQQFIDFRRLSDTLYRSAFSFGERLYNSFDSVVPFFNYPVNPSLPYSLNHLTFHFTGIDWAAPHRLRYSYQLEGHDQDWSLPQSESKAEYRNLPHGTYTLKIRATGTAQVWSEIVEYNFSIRPPWWYSWWAYILYTLATLLAIAGVYLYQRRRWQLQTRLEVEQEKANRLTELDHFKSRFYTNITHEFRTPLTVIKGMSDQIANTKSRTLIQRNTDRLLNMVNQLLDLSKLENNSLTINWVQADIIPFLQYLTESCHSLAQSKRVNLAFFSKEEQVVMDFDENKLQQLLINLLSNAIKFTPEFGSVKVMVSQTEEKEGPVLLLIIQDTGKGIPEGQLTTIFDRFYQVDNSSTRQEEGSGIGLALVKELIQLLGGRIEVDSVVGKGSSFSLYLPIHQEAAVQAEKDLPVSLALPAAVIGTAHQTPDKVALMDENLPLVLIIEDNADVTEYIVSCLTAHYAVETAQNGKEGIDKALEIVPDVILSDVMMPKMNGFEVCQQLKSDLRTSHIPIILLTAKATQEDKVMGLTYGADAYLTKPFDKQELLIRLTNLVNQSKRLREQLTHSTLPIAQMSESEQREVAFMKEVRQIIESNLDNELFDTHHLCRAIAMSRTQLHRKLKSLAGRSTADYIRSIRLQKAKSLLTSTDLPIGAIALEVGYKDFSHFSRSFLKEFDMRPSEVKR